MVVSPSGLEAEAASARRSAASASGASWAASVKARSRGGTVGRTPSERESSSATRNSSRAAARSNALAAISQGTGLDSQRDAARQLCVKSGYHDLPYGILVYPPEQEFALRRELALLRTRLELHYNKRVTTISLAECMTTALAAEGLDALQSKRTPEFGR